jgi:uncharacterized RDD family membrane protein YckC
MDKNLAELTAGAKASLSNANNKPFNLATPRRRYVGQFLDILIAWAIFIVCLNIVNLLYDEKNIASLLSILPAFIYFVFSDALPKGQSLGKRVLNISVIDSTNSHYCTLTQSFLRNILTPILGTIDAIFILSKKRQRLGDMMAKTVVIKND